MNIVVTKKFEKDVDKELDYQQKQELVAIIINLTQCKSLSEIQDCKKLKGYTNAYRLKLGSFRIGFLWQDENIYLSRVLNRKDIYKYFP